MTGPCLDIDMCKPIFKKMFLFLFLANGEIWLWPGSWMAGGTIVSFITCGYEMQLGKEMCLFLFWDSCYSGLYWNNMMSEICFKTRETACPLMAAEVPW